MKKILALILCSIIFITCGCFSDDIPDVPGSITIFNTDLDAYKIRNSRTLFGPEENATLVAKTNYYLSNVDDLVFYTKTGHHYGVLGTKDNKIYINAHVVRGSQPVKNFLPNSALSIYPKRYKLLKDHDDIEAFVWEFDNGYLALYVMTIPNWEFYNQIVMQAVYARNKKYLPLSNPI